MRTGHLPTIQLNLNPKTLSSYDKRSGDRPVGLQFLGVSRQEWKGDSYSEKFEISNFACCQVVAFCSLISELFLIMYALESFFPMLVIFFNLYGDFNGKMAKFQFLAINCSRSVLHLSSYHY